jgi:RNA polymerase sigma-70 factor (ECF subfamily)
MGEGQRKEGPDPIGSVIGRSGAELQALSSEELARRSSAGCRAAYSELVRRFGPRLLQFLQRRTNSLHDAEDLVQDTFIKAYTNIGRYRDSWRFSTWIFTIATRLANSHYRTSRYRPDLGRAEPDGADVPDVIARRESRQNLWALAGTLSKGQYQSLWLRYAEGMSIREIAKVLGKSQVNVRVLLYRARVNMAAKLQNTRAEGEQTGGKQERVKETLSCVKVEGA